MDVVEAAALSPSSDRPRRRVREEARDGLAVAAFSAAASSVFALVVAALLRLVS